MDELNKTIEFTEKNYREILNDLMKLDLYLAERLIPVFWAYGSLMYKKGTETTKEIYNLNK